MSDLNLLKELSELNGISSREGEVRRYIKISFRNGDFRKRDLTGWFGFSCR